MELAVVCADIGSVKNGGFGWWSTAGEECGRKPSELVDHVSHLLSSGRKVALGFEAPLFVPVWKDEDGLTKARPGEKSHPWSAGAGSISLAIAIPQTAWILREIRIRTSGLEISAFLKWKDFQEARRGLFLWEAFVTGHSKADYCKKNSGAARPKHKNGCKCHVKDAETGAHAFQHARDFGSLTTSFDSRAMFEAGECLSLIGASLLWSGWRHSSSCLSEPCVVVAAS